jgi:hypothetical protein
MNTTNNADLGTAENNPTTNTENDSAVFGTKEIADIISNKFLGGEELNGSPETLEGQEQAEGESTAYEQDSAVLSQENETTDFTSDSEDSEETEETKSEDEEIERGLPKGIKKRIDKLSAKRREAEAEVERLKEQVERLEQEANQPAQTPDANNPFNHLRSMDEINREADQAKQIRRWCEMNPDGAVVTKASGEEVEYTAEDVRKIKIKSMDALEEHLPKRAQFLQAYNQFDAVAQKDYTWWKDRSSKERQMAESFIKAFPEILRAPDHKLVLGHLITGIKVYENQKRVSSPQKVLAQPRSSASPVPLRKNQVAEQVAKQRFASSNSRDDLSTIIANKFL